MDRWTEYFKERFPISTYIFLVLGMVLSGLYLQYGTFRPYGFLIGFIGLFGFFAMLRLMDELKDFEKDQVAHPDRPLPRGLLKPGEVNRMINLGVCGMFAFALFVAITLNRTSGFCYALMTGYLWLMYREFYSGEWLENRPFTYAVTHQAILFPVAAFLISVGRPWLVWSPMTLAFGMMLMGAFFTYEICRKLDPFAHPILTTYVIVYGFRKTYIMVILTTLLAMLGAYGLGYIRFLWPFELSVLAVLACLFVAPKRYQLGELAATISLVVHVWAGVF